MLTSVPAQKVKKATLKNSKGSIGNRLEYSAQQVKNFRKGQYKMAGAQVVGAAATIGATGLVAKSKSAQQFIKNGFNKLKDSSFVKKAASEVKNFMASPEGKKIGSFLKGATEKVAKLPGPAKAVLAAGTVLTGIVVKGIQNKTLMDAGRIDQKYTDKAKVEKFFA